MRPALLLCALSLTLAAAQPAPAGPALPQGVVWTLQSLTEGGITTTLSGPRLTLRFDGQTASGVTTCTLYHADYVARAEVLRFGRLVTTRRACLDPRDGLDYQVLNLLGLTGRYQLSGGGATLTLLSGRDNRLVFAQAGARPGLALEGARWTLLGSGLAPVYFTFTQGRLSGSDGCNSFSGPARLSGATLQFSGPVASTRRACPGDQAASTLPRLLEQGLQVQLDPAGQTLTLQGGSVPLTFQRGTP